MKRVLYSWYAYLMAGSSVSPMFLTSCQMVVCAAATSLLPRSHSTHSANAVDSPETTRGWNDKLPIRILMSGALKCVNYAYVDLPVYFIQICKVPLTVSLLITDWDVPTHRLAKSFLIRQWLRSHGSHNIACRYPRVDNLLHIQAHHQQRLDFFRRRNDSRSRGRCIQHEASRRRVWKLLPFNPVLWLHAGISSFRPWLISRSVRSSVGYWHSVPKGRPS